ncbi:MAG: hypothetical protein JWN69_156, partial [Alphaproteobacteria bacterium]|nr:hypothetical protein [Alphaproteobacteria bacterium]
MTAGLLALRSSIPLVDRYICRLTLRPLLLAIATIVFILSLETLPRLLEKLNGVVNRTELVFLSLMSLAPEYIGIALPIALFLATALAFRQLALNGELDALAASGMSDLR